MTRPSATRRGARGRRPGATCGGTVENGMSRSVICLFSAHAGHTEHPSGSRRRSSAPTIKVKKTNDTEETSIAGGDSPGGRAGLGREGADTGVHGFCEVRRSSHRFHVRTRGNAKGVRRYDDRGVKCRLHRMGRYTTQRPTGNGQ